MRDIVGKVPHVIAHDIAIVVGGEHYFLVSKESRDHVVGLVAVVAIYMSTNMSRQRAGLGREDKIRVLRQ